MAHPGNRADIPHVSFRQLAVGSMASVSIARHETAAVLGQVGYILHTGDWSRMSYETAKLIARMYIEAGYPVPPECSVLLGTHSPARSADSQYSLSTIGPRRDILGIRDSFDRLFGERVNLNSVQHMLVISRRHSTAGAAERRRVVGDARALLDRLDGALPRGRVCVVPRYPTDDEIEEMQDSDYSSESGSGSGTESDLDLLGWADDDSDLAVDGQLGDEDAEGGGGGGGVDGTLGDEGAGDGGDGDGDVPPVTPSPMKRAFLWVRDRLIGSG